MMWFKPLDRIGRKICVNLWDIKKKGVPETGIPLQTHLSFIFH